MIQVESSSVPVNTTVSLPEAASATSSRAEATSTSTTGAASTSMLTVTHEKSSDKDQGKLTIPTETPEYKCEEATITHAVSHKISVLQYIF